MTRQAAPHRPKLLFTVNDAGFFLSHRLPVALAARDAGYEVHIATAPGAAVARIRDLGFTHHPVPLSRRGLNPVAEAGTLWSLYRLYRRLRPALIHHVTAKPVLYGGIAARLAGAPAVVSAVSGLGYVFIHRGWKAGLLRLAIKIGYRWALRRRGARVIFQNPDDRETFLTQAMAAAKDSVLIKGSGADVTRFIPSPEPEGLPVVVLPARMLWDKGVGEFVEAARHLNKDNPCARFVLAGDTDGGNPTAVPAADLRRWQNEGAVEWWGFRSDMAAVLQQAHIVCLPSYREGLPKSLIEAAACARPIVSCDVPGCREIARAGENALLVPPRDSTALAKALGRLIGDATLRQDFGARGREIVEAEFSLDRVIDETLDLYAALMRETGGRTPCPPA